MATTGDSPRDHTADANQHLSRKRLCYSAEHGTMSPSKKSRSPSLGGSNEDDADVQLIEICDADSEGISTHTVQMLDIGIPPVPLAMSRWPNLTPTQQVLRMSQQLGNDTYLDEESLSAIKEFLEEHNKLIDEQGSIDVDTTIYLQEEEFFGALGQLCLDILQKQDEPFDLETSTFVHRGLLIDFLAHIMPLAARVVSLLPYITKEQLSRRDSAQGHTTIGSRHIVLWRYAEIVAQIISADFPIATFLVHHCGLDPDDISDTCRKEILKQEEPFSALVAAFDNIARASKEVRDGWSAAAAIMKIVNQINDVSAVHLEAMLCTITESILPVICEQHPRVLPPTFHEIVINFSQDAMYQCVRQLDLIGSSRLYKQFIQSDADAVLPEGVADQDLATALHSASDESPSVLLFLLSIAWSLQATTRYIHSSVMEIRSTGVSLLVGRLREVHKTCINRPARLEHPLACFAARFIRTNELTKYIFSAESHATLIAQSQDIVCFLGVTNSYTNQETDIIWTACTTNVEAEFVKVSFKVLRAVCGCTSIEHIVYIAELYRDTPPEVLSLPVIDFLPELFSLIRNLSDHLPVENQLATAWISFEILQRCANTVSPSDNSLAMARKAMDELALYATHSSEVRLRILQRYIPHILNRTPSATTVAELLSLFFEQSSEEEEMSRILAMLPVDELVYELCHFSETAPQRGTSRLDVLAAVAIRLGPIIHLMSRMPSGSNMLDTENLLYELLFDNLALSNEARDTALRKLAQMAEDKVGRAPQLLDRYLNEYASSLPVTYVTPALLELMVQPLKGRIAADALQSTPAQLLTHPLWLTLQKVAETACDIMTAHEAINAICQLLFDFPKTFVKHHVPNVVQIQRNFVYHLLESLELDFDGLQGTQGRDAQVSFLRRIDILDALMRTSFNSRAIFGLEEQVRELNLCRPSTTLPKWSFSCEVHLAQGQPLMLGVLVNDEVKMCELSQALSTRTSASHNRVIVSGQCLDLELKAQETLRSVGIEPSTTILVAPKYTSFCDLNNVLAPDIPVHKVLSEEYHRIERFVDGPMLIAERTYYLLRDVAPSISARSRLSASSLQIHEALPKERPWRLMLSLQILHVHLSSSVKLGIADEQFMSNIIRLLAEFVVTSVHNEHMDLTLEVTSCLVVFLREHSSLEDNIAALLPSKQRALIRRLSSIMRHAIDLPQHLSVTTFNNLHREPLILTSYDCLLQVARHDPATWLSIGEDEVLRDLIPLLLCDDNAFISETMESITLKHCKAHRSTFSHLDYFWTVLSGALDKALQCHFTCAPFFRVASHVLAQHVQLPGSVVRASLVSWLSIVTPYQHTETLALPFTDLVMVGILELIATAIDKLKASNTPLQVGDLGTWLFKRLLFPVEDDSGLYHPLLFPESRAVAFRVLRLTCDSGLGFKSLVGLSNQALLTLSPDSTKDYPGHDRFIRRSNVSAGLTNLGMTCYMNALLQQLFGNLRFRKFILESPIVNPVRQEVLERIQALFAWMQDSSEPCINTTPLADSLGIEIDSQDDVHGFFAILISRLEDVMPNDNARETLKGFFAGKFVSQVRGECGHVSTRVDSFNDISITVRNKSGLHESLDEFVQGEPMQGSNKYKCLTCEPVSGGRLVNAMKRTCLDEVPDNLTFCLKRFTWEGGFEDKVNDRFEFPEEIDMSRYGQQHLESPSSSQPDVFELTGVIVHQGTLSFGHYWSYVRTGSANELNDPKWKHLEDSRTTPVKGGVKEVQEECFGGQQYTNGNERTDNAYVLLYQRKVSRTMPVVALRRPCEQQTILDQLLPTVPISERLAEQIAVVNKWRYRIGHLFHDDFAQFLTWALSTASEFKFQIVDANERFALISQLSQLASTSLLKLVLNNPEWENGVETFLTSLGAVRSAHVHAAACLLNHLTQDFAAYSNIWTYPKTNIRALASTFLLNCLKEMKETTPHVYGDCLRKVLDAHSYLWIRNVRDFAQRWAEYFAFLSALSAWGEYETKKILDTLDISIFTGLICGAVCEDPKERDWLGMRRLHRIEKLDLGPIFSFLQQVLRDHVDLDTQPGSICADTGLRPSTARGICLRESEVDFLRGHTVHTEGRNCNIIHYAYQCDADLAQWETYSPGMLIALLIGPKDIAGGYQMPIYDYLLELLRKGEENLNRMLCLSLHYCRARSNGPDTTRVVKEVAALVSSWDDAEPQGLAFMQECYALAPIAVVTNVVLWAPAFLFTREPMRTKTMRFLEDHVLQLSDEVPSELDMARLACLRKLTPLLTEKIRKMQRVGHARSTFEAASKVVYHARMYLRDMTRRSTGWNANNAIPGGGYSTQSKMKIQLDEAAATRTELEELSRLLSDWMANSSTSDSSNDAGVTTSVEEGSVAGDDDKSGDKYDEETDFEEEEE